MLRSVLFVVMGLALCPMTELQGYEKTEDKNNEAELDKLFRDLRNKNINLRVKAAKSLGEKGGDAPAVAGRLCEALLDLSPMVRVSALEALEKIRPDLYNHLSTLLVDFDDNKRLRTIKELGLMGEKASPVVPVLLANLRKEIAKPSGSFSRRGLSEFVLAYFAAIRQIKPEDTETIKLYKVIAGKATQNPHSRLEAINFLNEWAGEDSERRKGLLPLIKDGLDDSFCQLTCINICGSYGAMAKEFVPKLKKLKLSAYEEVRKEASAAIEKIETP